MLRYDLDDKLRRNLLRLIRSDDILKLLLGNLPCSKFDLEQISFIVVNNSFLWFVEYMVRTPYMIVIKRDSK